MNAFAVKGDICYSISPRKIETVNNGYIIVDCGKISGVTLECPNIPVHDYSGHIIIPGMTDLHTHAPQYKFRGLGMNMQLLDWLNTLIFPEEGRYSDTSYAEQIYSSFADDMRRSPAARAVIFGTIHAPAAKILMDKMENSGLVSYVGKVSMNRNAPDYLIEAEPLEAVEAWLRDTASYRNTKPILTPRFTPSCSDELMRGLGELREKYSLPVQSHLSENISEVQWVKELCTWSKNYADTYDRFGLLEGKSIMAHCIHLNAEEILLLKERGTFIAHCPHSNINLSSGIAPIRKYIDTGMNIGLATDIAGVMYISMFRAVTAAVGVSKLRSSVMENEEPLTFEEAFYLATMGGGKFFGLAGSFIQGYEADIIVLSGMYEGSSIRERLEKEIYLAGDDAKLSAKYAAGRKLF